MAISVTGDCSFQDRQEEKLTSRLEFLKDELKPASILTASVLADKGILQKLGSFVMKLSRHTFRKTNGGLRERWSLYRPSSCLTQMRQISQPATTCVNYKSGSEWLLLPSAYNDLARISLVTFPIQKLQEQLLEM